MTMLTKNSFLEEIPQAVRADRARQRTYAEYRALQAWFRKRRDPAVTGFPGAFIVHSSPAVC